MALDIILRVPACAPVNEVADFIVEAEEAGFAGVGIPDTQLVTRDAFVALALAAERTSHIMLYPAVTNPVTRHVSVIASLIRTIEELAPSRVHPMLGTGFSAVRTIGRRPATLASMRECTAPATPVSRRRTAGLQRSAIPPAIRLRRGASHNRDRARSSHPSLGR